jgi:hypothetical protein
MLEPLGASWRTGAPIHWQRVQQLPDYVFFNHSIHVNKGLGCTTCHGAVGKMPLMRKAETLYMKWCLDCHRDPAPNLRPREEIYNVAYRFPADRRAQGERLMDEYQVDLDRLTNCTACHR